VKDFGLVGICCNRMGARFNSISLSIVNSESRDAIESSWDASVLGFFNMLNNCRLCASPECGFCSQVREQDKPHMRELLLSDDAKRLHYQVDKPSSDCTKQFWRFAKKKSGPDMKVQTCGQHATGDCPYHSEIFGKVHAAARCVHSVHKSLRTSRPLSFWPGDLLASNRYHII
jgi:hypothetical protein